MMLMAFMMMRSFSNKMMAMLKLIWQLIIRTIKNSNKWRYNNLYYPPHSPSYCSKISIIKIIKIIKIMFKKWRNNMISNQNKVGHRHLRRQCMTGIKAQFRKMVITDHNIQGKVIVCSHRRLVALGILSQWYIMDWTLIHHHHLSIIMATNKHLPSYLDHIYLSIRHFNLAFNATMSFSINNSTTSTSTLTKEWNSHVM